MPALGFVATRSATTTLAGALAAQSATLTLTICAASFAQARQVAADVRTAMQGANNFIKRLMEEPGDEYDPESRRYLYHLTYFVWEIQGETTLPPWPGQPTPDAGDEIVRHGYGVRRWTGAESPVVCAVALPQSQPRGLVEIAIEGTITNGDPDHWRHYRATIRRGSLALDTEPVQAGIQAGETGTLSCKLLDEPGQSAQAYTLTLTQSPAGNAPSVARLSLTVTQY